MFHMHKLTFLANDVSDCPEFFTDCLKEGVEYTSQKGGQ